MKKRIPVLCVLIAAILCGCGQQEEEKEIPSYQYDCPGITCATESEELPVNVIETKYYTVNLPLEWAGKCVDEIQELEDGTEALTFYEKESYEVFGGGKLCTIRLLPEGVEWSSVPDATLFGALKTPDGLYVIIGIFPSDKQYNKETWDTYNAMRALTAELFESITPNEGCTLIRKGY